MNFIVEYKKGQQGGNKGLPMGAGLERLSKAINGVQRARMYGLASAPKVGKSTLTDYGFVIQPLLYAIAHRISIEIIYFSLEIDRVSKEFDFAAYFFFHDFGIHWIELPPGITKDGDNKIQMSSDYLRGRMQDDNGEIIRVPKDIEDKLKIIYEKRIVPLFGEYDEKGGKIKNGYITIIEFKDNPTGIRKFLIAHAKKNGTFINDPGNTNRINSYIPRDPNKYTIIVTDHLRKLVRERGFTLKENVDKFIEYSVELRNWCAFTFIHIIHLNRSVTDVGRMRSFGDLLYPTSDDIKDTGNLSEEADYIFTMFNPNDSRYNLNKHFGLTIKDSKGNELFPNMRTIHLVESRHCTYPQHFRVNMEGAIKNFSELKINNK